jgi:hypothetical protein
LLKQRTLKRVSSSLESCAGSDTQRLLVLEISRVDDSAEAQNVMVADERGQITFVTHSCAHLLGYHPPHMVGKMNIGNLMHAPFSILHTKWLAVSCPGHILP